METPIVSEYNVHIPDSWMIRTRSSMRDTLDTLRKHYDSQVWKRTDTDLIREWRGHNLLYDLHLFRSHTKDVDLDYPQSWQRQIVWAILSFFYIGFDI